MSDLQVSLLIIGLLVVGGVTAFNWFQQWRLRRKLEDAFGDKHEDVLLREEPVRTPAPRTPAAAEPGYDASEYSWLFDGKTVSPRRQVCRLARCARGCGAGARR